MKIGRNDLCPCGSGKKFKKCHLAPQSPAILQPSIQHRDPLPPHVIQQFEQQRREQEERKNTFGDIRPMIHLADHNGFTLVGVHGTIYYSQKWKFFTDFLFEYGLIRMGIPWRDANRDLSIAEQHPLYYWHRQSFEYMQRQNRQPEGYFKTVPNGMLAACKNFYYDLYIVDDNTIINEVLLDRLRDRDQFQGAMHELFVQATCIRAGFDIIPENERDPSRKHVEFIAVHKATKQHILVEAKSRHRPGVMARKGKRDTTPETCRQNARRYSTRRSQRSRLSCQGP